MKSPLFKGTTPADNPTDILGWMEQYVLIRGRVSFSRNTRPWLNEPILKCFDKTIRRNTFIKPVQVAGGSTAGQLVECAWAKFGFGEIHHNWPDNPRAQKEWEKDILPMFEACKEMEWQGGRFDRVIGQAKFKNSTVIVQGVEAQGNLASDTVPKQINDELHLWGRGDLAKARGRQSAAFLPIAFDISNAGDAKPKGLRDTDLNFELHDAFLEGTQQHWEVLCPGCKKFHRMRMRFDERYPKLGGLRYDSTKGPTDDGLFNYTKLIPTIRYQMPCGYALRYDPENNRDRRKLSESGKYSDPRPDAFLPYRSYTLQAISCHTSNWVELIQKKHAALNARKHGDKERWRVYIIENECDFYSEEDAPLQGIVLVSPKIKKNREGLKKHPKFATRIAMADKQRGYKARGELTHYWLVIEDVLQDCNSQVVFEGLIQNDSELIAVLKEHEVDAKCVVIDASWDTKNVLEFCYWNGFNAVMGNLSKKESFLHPDGTRRFYSDNIAIYAQLNTAPKFNRHLTKDGWVDDINEPIVIFYNKAGLLTNHFFIRDHKANVLANNKNADNTHYIEREIPADVSSDFIEQNESWERVIKKQASTNDDVEGFRKTRTADHLLMCLAYGDLLKCWAGLLGDRLALLGIQEPTAA